MRFAYSIKQKMKIAVLLFCIMACTLLIRYLEDKSVKSMNQSFISLYNDRLVPATDLFYIAEYVDEKQRLIENILYTGKKDHFNFDVLNHELLKINASIDSLIRAYEKTYLVKQEKENITALKANLKTVRLIERNTIVLIKDENIEKAKTMHELSGRKSAGDIVRGLSELMRIQRQVGAELTKDTEFMVSGNKLYSAFQTVLAIVIGILIVGIVFTSNVVNIRNDKFNLN